VTNLIYRVDNEDDTVQSGEEDADKREDNDRTTNKETHKCKSQLWNLFTKENANSVICIFCSKSLACYGETGMM